MMNVTMHRWWLFLFFSWEVWTLSLREKPLLRAMAFTAREPPTTTTTVGAFLSAQFQHVFEHFAALPNNTTSLNEEQIRTNLLRTRHSPFPLAYPFHGRIAVSAIPNAGYGVVVTRDIPKGECITLYPGDALLQWPEIKEAEENSLDTAAHGLHVLFGTHIPETERRAALDPSSYNNEKKKEEDYMFMRNIRAARDYEVRISEKISLIGDPGRCQDPAYLGHMINDYCTIAYPSHTDSSMTDEAELERQYNIQSITASNCKIQIGTPDACHVEIVSTRPIAAGEECFLSYGTDYWRTRRRRRQGQEWTSPLSPPAVVERAIPSPVAPAGFAKTKTTVKRRKR